MNPISTLLAHAPSSTSSKVLHTPTLFTQTPPRRFWTAMVLECKEGGTWDSLYITRKYSLTREEVENYCKIFEEMPQETLQTLDSHPLHFAAYLGSKTLLKALNSWGYNLSGLLDTPNEPQSPLTIAFTRGNREAFRWLLKNDAEPECTIDQLLLTCFQKGLGAYAADIIEFTYGAEPINCERAPTVLHEAVAMGNLALIQFLLEAGMHVDTTATGKTALYVAIETGQLEVARLLLDHYASTDHLFMCDDSYQWHPLFIAACNRDVESVELLTNAKACLNAFTIYALLKKGYFKELNFLFQHEACDMQAIGRRSFYPLHQAVSENDIEAVKFLLSHGASPHCQADSLITPLHIAATRGLTDIILLLIDSGASVYAQDSTGWTPMQILGSCPLLYSLKASLPKDKQYLLQDLPETPPIFFPYADNGRFENDPWRWKEKVMKKLCGSAFGIGGISTTVKYGATKDLDYTNLEGFASDTYLLERVCQHMCELQKLYPKHTIFQDAAEMCAFSAKNATLSAGDYLKRIKENKPTILYTGFDVHSVECLFWGKQLFLCNRGRGAFRGPSVEVYNIDLETLTEEMIERLRGVRLKTENAYQKLFYRLLDNKDPYDTSFGPVFEKSCPLLPIASGHCTYKNLEGALWVFFTGREAKGYYGLWVQHAKHSFAKEYIESHLSEENPFIPDMVLCEKMMGDLTAGGANLDLALPYWKLRAKVALRNLAKIEHPAYLEQPYRTFYSRYRDSEDYSPSVNPPALPY